MTNDSMNTESATVKGFPLSRQQQTVFKQQANWPQRALSSCWLSLPQGINVAGLSEWLTQLVDRHEALRIQYHQEIAGALPIQVIGESYAVKVQTVDSANHHWDQQTDQLQAALITGDQQSSRLHLALPRMSVDAQSWQVIAQELSALMQGHALSDVDEVVQYIDFADWQDEVVAEDAEARDYWNQYWSESQRAKSLSLTRLPGEQSTQTIASAQDSVLLPLAASVNATHLRAAFAWLLGKWLGHEQVSYNLIADGRLSDDFAEGIGAYQRSLPCRVELSADGTLGEWLTAIAADDELLLANQMSAPIQAPLPSYSFQYMAATSESPISIADISEQQNGHSLLLQFVAASHQAQLCYCAAAWDHHWVTRLAEMIVATAETFASEAANTELSALALLDNEKAKKYYDSYNQHLDITSLTAVSETLISQLCNHAKHSAHSLAVSDSTASISYAQLVQRMALHAKLWQSTGLTAGQSVAVHGHRNIALTEAMLAILACGAHYIAIDPALPEARKQWLLSRCDYCLSLTGEPLEPANCQQLTLSNAASETISEADAITYLQTLNQQQDSGNLLAYLLFTSGSTGEPKGVQITQQALHHYLAFAAEEYCADVDVSLVHTSIGFDLTVTSLFAPLWAGKQVLMVPETAIGIENLTNSLENLDKLTKLVAPKVLLKLTPAHLKALAPWVQTPVAANVKLHRLVVGGEALAAADVAGYFQHYPTLAIINEYGPTEATVGCSIHQVSPTDKGNICIGQPITRMGFYVLDEQQQIVAPGIAGELYIAGQGVAHGYDKLQQATAERFVYIPHLPSQRLYKTGDVVRLVAAEQGYYEFLGRNDRQVKVRGYRVELEEIEASIKQHLPCSDAVVLTRQNQHQVTELVAYLQAADTQADTKPLSADQLAELLQPHLPEYMQPTQWVVLAEFPLTVNGKVDLKALPSLANQQQQAYVAPSSALEKQLVDIWQTALNLERVGIQDNFFTLGGDSIRGVHVVALCKTAGLNVSIQQVFSAKTIAALAELLSENDESQAPAEQTPSYQEFSMISEQDREKLPQDVEDAYPLGTVQLGMLYHMHTTRDANTPPDYHNVASFRLRLDHTFQPDLFQQAVDKVVEVEPYLRASFELTRFSQPLQLIHRQAKLRVGYHDLRGSDSAQQQLEQFVQEENFRLIDTTRAPLMRLRVHHFEDALISLSLTEPHSLADGWSTHLTLIDIFSVYLQLIDGQPVQITPVQTRYSEFVKAEQETIASDASKIFWEEQINRAVNIELPPKALQSHQDQLGEHRHRLPIPKAILRGLTQAAAQAQVPMKSVLMAAHMRLLALLSGETTITTGLNFNGRLETDDGIKVRGLFLNMLPVTLDLTGGSWIELAQAAHKAEIDILPHRRYPLGLLLSEFGKDKLFDSALSFLHFHSLATESEQMEQRVISEGIIDHSKTNYDFNAVFDRDPFDPESLTYIGDANLDRFTRRQLDQFLGFYLAILQDIAQNPSADYRRSHFLNEEQLANLTEWQQGCKVTQLEVSQPVVEQFEKLAIKQPDGLALIAQDQTTLSYRELHDNIRHFAGALQQKGVKAGDFVALHLPRSVAAVTAILALHKLGAAYIPLETSYPHQRIQDVLVDSQAPWIISEQTALALPQSCQQISVAELQQASVEHVTFAVVDPESCAYVLYTSGSTGKPKGVKISQRALSDYVTWAAQQYVADSDSRNQSLADLPSLVFPLFSPLSFDLTVTSLFTPLVTGGAIAIYHSDDAAALIEQIVADNRVDIIKMTPAHLALLQVLPIQQWKVSRIIVGGEQLQGQLAKSITDAMNNVVIFNEYGPTETTVGCSVHRFDPDTDAEGAVPIGVPANNTTALVLDAYGLPVPVGVKGELYIAGNGVADGYVAREQLNQERFVELALLENQKAYRTGDLVRWRDDGQLLFVGRMDDQVKIRGYRIELGEVEAVIASNQQVAQVIVDVEGQGQDKQLIAYVVRHVNAEVDAAQLRHHCSEQLPEYMLPSRTVFVPYLPLTSNGKIDRKKLNFLLADTDTESEVVTREYEAPRNTIETILCEIWQEALHGDRVGINDNFFELGGHSIQALHLIPTIQDRLNVRLSLTEFLKNPTVKSVSEQLAQQGDAEITEQEQLPKIGFDTDNLHLAFPLTPVQQAYLMGRSSVFELGNVATHSYIEFEWQNMDVDHFQACFNRLVQRHDMLRAVFSEQGEQRILTDIQEYPIHYQDYSELSDPAREQALLQVRSELSHQVLAIDQWPLFDLRVSRLNSQRCRVHFSMDALLADAMSFDIIDKEITAMYLQGVDAELPEIATSFRDYVLAERELQQSQLFANAKQYWLDRLASLPEAPQLPLAKQPSEILHPTFERRHFRLPKTQWKNLQGQASRLGVTPTVMVLTLFSSVLRQWCKNDSFTLNLTLFNRLPLHEHVNHLIGDFTSLTLLQIDTQADDTLRSAASRIQQQLWNDLEHRIFGGMDVLRALNAHEGRIQAANMPIVFSSTLGLNEGVEQEADPLDVDATFSITQTPQVWLDHQVTEEFGELVLSWDAIAALFPAGMLDAMFASYTQLVEKVAAGEAIDLSYLGLPADHQAVYQHYNQTELDVVAPLAVNQEQMYLHTPFILQVQKQPHRIAVISSEITLTYQQLHQRACAVAQQLQQHKVNSGELVAVVMEKGWQQTVAVLGILYAGAAYLPIDAHQPRKRLEQVLALGESRISLIQHAQEKHLSWLSDTQTVISVDALISENSDFDAQAAVRDITQLAYVIFTSGSTGTPKGVMIDHRGAVNTCLDVNQRYGIGSDDRVLAISALNFDLSVYDIFGLLAAGGAIVVPDADKEKDPHHWAHLVQSHQVSVWNSVPAIAHLLIEEVQKHQAQLAIPSLKLIMMSGDWIPLELPEDARAIRPDIQLISMGGATEASIWSIYYPIEAIQPHWHSIPYGRPLANQGFHVFNQHMQPCPLWVAGELYISGIGLAQGYWKDAPRSAASFVHHPLTGERFYRTGDLGRMLPDGNIEFLGREDNQVKLHGHRVELGEVEAVIAMQPQVKSAAVIVHTTNSNQKHLLAYVVADESESEAADSIIDDAIEFKLAQHGLLPYEQGAQTLSLPRNETLQLAKHSAACIDAAKPLAQPATALSLQAVGQWLSALAAQQMPNQALTKRHYPSAGSLYPVRTWLVLPQACAELAAGCYYYDPSRHQLLVASASSTQIPVDVAALLNADAPRLYLQSVPDAITPIYGDNSARFTRLEMGHMLQILQDIGVSLGLTLIDITAAGTNDLGKPDCVATIAAFSAEQAALGVDSFAQPLTLTPLNRQSIREFAARDISLTQLNQWLSVLPWQQWGEQINALLYLRPGKVSDGEGGYYRFDSEQRKLIHVCDDESARGYTLYGDNQVIEREASFSLYFIAENNADAWLQAGALGQSLMQQAHRFELGVCPVGKVHQSRLRLAKLTDEQHSVVYAFEGGVVHAHAYEQWPSLADTSDAVMQEIYKDELRVRLPYYMIPDFFTVLEELPLTANGKIDRKSLPIPEFAEASVHEFVAPADAIEQHLWQFCANNLHAEQISCQANLLELGADSLFAIRFVSEVRVAFGVEMNLRAFFEQASIQAMAALIRQEDGQLRQQSLDTAQAAAVDEVDDELEEGTL